MTKKERPPKVVYLAIRQTLTTVGGTFLSVDGEPPKRIHGEFWTSRDTKGTLDMDSHVSVVAQTFPDAEAMFLEAPRAE